MTAGFKEHRANKVIQESFYFNEATTKKERKNKRTNKEMQSLKDKDSEQNEQTEVNEIDPFRLSCKMFIQLCKSVQHM